MSNIPLEPEVTPELANRVIYGDKAALAQIFDVYRMRLRRIVNFRLDRRIYGRVDPDDVLQEAYLNAQLRMKSILADRAETLFIWLRKILNQTLADVHRRHLGTKKRARPNATSRSTAAGRPNRPRPRWRFIWPAP